MNTSENHMNLLNQNLKAIQDQLLQKKHSLIVSALHTKFGIELTEKNAEEVTLVTFTDEPDMEYYYYKPDYPITNRRDPESFIIAFDRVELSNTSEADKVNINAEIKYIV